MWSHTEGKEGARQKQNQPVKCWRIKIFALVGQQPMKTKAFLLMNRTKPFHSYEWQGHMEDNPLNLASDLIYPLHLCQRCCFNVVKTERDQPNKGKGIANTEKYPPKCFSNHHRESAEAEDYPDHVRSGFNIRATALICQPSNHSVGVHVSLHLYCCTLKTVKGHIWDLTDEVS